MGLGLRALCRLTCPPAAVLWLWSLVGREVWRKSLPSPGAAARILQMSVQNLVHLLVGGGKRVL